MRHPLVYIVEAADDMFAETDKKNAPWILIVGDDKKYARIEVLKQIIAHVKKECAHRGLKITDPAEATSKEV